MGLLLQIAGIVIVLVSLVFGIISIVNGNRTVLPVILVIGGSFLVRFGRKMYHDGSQKS